jgi:CRISPR-associated protein Csm1
MSESQNSIVLSIFQEVLVIAANNVDKKNSIKSVDNIIAGRAKELINWPENPSIAPLRSIFDDINIEGKKNSSKNYWPLQAIANNDPPIPYPVTDKPAINKYQQDILQPAIQNLSSEDWQNSTILGLFLDKYCSCISFGAPNIALNDIARSTAAIAAALAQAQNHGKSVADTQFRLIAGDISGIQKFIYNISSDGALKSLRARSFFLELLTIEIVHQLVSKLQLPESNVIYAGGGNIYILAADLPEVETIVAEVQHKLNDWFITKYQGQLYLALDSIGFPQDDINTAKFAEHWKTLTTQKLSNQKNRKFFPPDLLERILEIADSHEPCKVCHQDNSEDLQPLNPEDPNSVSACITCRSMFQLGTQLFKSRLIIRSHTRPNLTDRNAHYQAQSDYPQYVAFNFGADDGYYRVYGRPETDNEDNLAESIDRAIDHAKAEKNTTNILLIDNWDLDNYRKLPMQPILLGNYYQTDDISPDVRRDAFIKAEELATKASGIDRVGYLRMDVDNLGEIFASGLPERERSLTQLTALSRQMNYFFKVYLNSLAAERKVNTDGFAQLTTVDRPDLLFIYTGGDDIFISGAWNQIAEFAGDIYQSFRAYTGHNPSITISGGISISSIKYPLYQAAAEAGEAEDLAKANDKDSLSLFGKTFHWSHWLGTIGTTSVDAAYLQPEPSLDTNILQLVQALADPSHIGYSRSFIRNLLVAANIRQQKIKDLKKNDPTRQDLIYYLHLPQIEYAISRLPQRVRDDPTFQPVRQALRNPRSSPYFRTIATWVELLNRKSGDYHDDRD